MWCGQYHSKSQYESSLTATHQSLCWEEAYLFLIYTDSVHSLKLFPGDSAVHTVAAAPQCTNVHGVVVSRECTGSEIVRGCVFVLVQCFYAF